MTVNRQEDVAGGSFAVYGYDTLAGAAKFILKPEDLLARPIIEAKPPSAAI